MNNELELLRNAHLNSAVKVEFEIKIKTPEGETVVPVMLTSGDRFEIAKIQEDIKTDLYIQYKKKGWDREPIIEAEWREGIDRISNPEARKRLLEQRPCDLAMQRAQRYAQIRTIQELMPRFLKKANGDKLCPTDADVEILKQIVCESPALMTLFAEKFTELMVKENEIGEAVKNSSTQESSTNGSLETP